MSNEPMRIDRFGSDLAGLVQDVGSLLNRVHEVCSAYVNSTKVVNLSDERHGKNGTLLSWDVAMDLKDIFVLAVITQANLAYRGSTDMGKSFLAELGLSAVFGAHGDGWWKAEVGRAMTVDDFVDIDLGVLKDSKLSEAVSAAPWLAFPGRLLDEINRSHSKINNILLHLIDGSGLHLSGNLHIPVGFPYRVDETAKRYSFTVVTANQRTQEYGGTYDEDKALVRRIILSMDLDDYAPSAKDIATLLKSRRPKFELPNCSSMLHSVLRVYESLSETLPFSPLAQLFLHYLSGLGTCIRTRSGRVQPNLQPAICDKCHLSKSNRFCGHVSGPSEGLLLWLRELSLGIAAIRGAKVLQRVRKDCLAGRIKEIQEFLDSKAQGQELYEAFVSDYIEGLTAMGEDVVAAFSLGAPYHVFIDKSWLEKQDTYEKSEIYAFADIAASSWNTMSELLKKHESLFSGLAADNELSHESQSQVEVMISTVNAAILPVVLAIRDKPLPLRFREDLSVRRNGGVGRVNV